MVGQVDTQQPSEDARTRVFLSYSRKDAALVQRVADGLMMAGFLADFDQAAHDPGNVSAGISAEDEWWKRLQEMIASADVMVFLVSPDSAQSAVCDEEIAYARALGKRIIAVLVRPVDFARAPPRLSALNVRIDFSEGGPGFDAALAELVAALETNVGWHRDGRKYFARVQEWDTAGRPKSRLLREGAVEEAERWAVTRPRGEPEPGELFLAWIAASRTQIRRDASVRTFWRRVTAIFVLTTLAATLVGAWFVVNGQRNLGRSESLMLARTSDQFYNEGDYLRALHLAILASRSSFLAPSTDEAKAAFAKSAQALRLVSSIQVSEDPDTVIVWAEPVADDRNLLVKTNMGTAELWSLETGERLGPVMRAEGDGAAPEISLSENRKLALIIWQTETYGVNTETGVQFGPIKPETGSLSGLDSAVAAPDGSAVLLRDQASGMSLRDGATGERIAVFGADGTFGRGADISDDGRTAAVATERAITFWDMQTKQQVGVSFAAPTSPLWQFRLSPDGGRLLVWAEGMPAAYADTMTGAQIPLAGLPEAGLTEALFVPESGRLIAVRSDRLAQIFDTETGAAIGEPVIFDPTLEGITASVKDGRLLSLSYLSGMRVVSLETGEVLSEPAEGEASQGAAVLVPGSGGFLAWDGRSVWYTAADGSGAPSYGLISEHPGFIEDVVPSPDGLMFLTYSSEGEVRQWDFKTGVQVGEALRHTNFDSRGGYLGDGSLMVTVDGPSAHVWRTRDYERSGPKTLPDGEALTGSLMSPDGLKLLAWNDAGRAVLWDVAKGTAIGPGILTGEQGYWGAAFDGAGARLALWYENQLQMISTETGEGQAQLLAHAEGVTQGAFSPDGSRLVTVDVGGQAYVWDTVRMEAVGPARAHQGYGVPPMDASGTRMAVFSELQAELVDLSTGAAIGAPLLHSARPDEDNAVLGAAFSDTGGVLVTWSAWEFHLWDAQTGTARVEPVRPDEFLNAAALSGDGSRVLAVLDGRSEVYDTATGELAGPAFAKGMVARGGVLSADGALAATWGDDTMLRLWDVASGTQIGNAYQTGLMEQEGRFTVDGRRLLVTEPGGTFRIVDTATGDVVSEMSQSYFGGGYHWDEAAGRLVTHPYEGEVWTWDIADALRRDAGPADVAEVCTAKLSGTLSDGVPFVRRLDSATTFEAPILRGREGEDVCAPPPAAWWETAAGAVFGWAFR